MCLTFAALVYYALSGYLSAMTPSDRAAEAASNLRAELSLLALRSGEMALALGMSPETPLDVNELCAFAEWLDIPVTRLLPASVNTTSSGLLAENHAVFDMVAA